MGPQNPVPPPPVPTSRSNYTRAPLGSGPRRRPPPAPQRRSGVLLGVVYFFLFVLIAGGAGVGYLLVNPPSNLIRQKIAEQVRAKTGRELVMAGPASFTFYPALGLSLRDVSLSGPPGMDGNLVHMQSLDVRIKLSSLLSRHVEIRSLVLKKPTFDLRIDKSGRHNWQFSARSAPVRYAELQTPGTRSDAEQLLAAAEPAPIASKTFSQNDLRLDDVRIEDGTFRFTDERSGRIEEIGSVNTRFGIPSLSKPLTAAGNLAWHGKRVDFDGKLADVANLGARKPSHLSFTAKNEVLSASYDGGVLVNDGVYLEGDVTAEAPSARALAAWFGTQLPPVSGFGPLSIEGTLKTGGNVTTFSKAAFGLDGASAKGTIKVTTGGVRPKVEANLAIGELDLNKYLTSAVTGGLAPEGSGTSGGAAPPQPDAWGAPTQPDQIEKFLNSKGTKVYGALQRAGWSSERLNLTLLGVADGTAQLSVGKLHFKDVNIGQSSVGVVVKDYTMQATFDDVQLYQGQGKGVVTVDGSKGNADIDGTFNLMGVSALPFLRDAAHFEWLSGNADVGFQLKASGASQLQLVESLNGNAKFKFSDGAIVGFNLPGAVRGLSNGDLSGLRTSPSAKTDFSALGATFSITNGVAENKDLQLVSPLLRVTGGGVIHMPERTVDYTVKPKLVASLEGQQGDAGENGIEIPVRISGSWDRPAFRPELKGLLSDPGKAVETIKEIGKKFKGKKADEIVNDVLGKKDGDDEQTAKAKAKAKKFLNKLFGKDDDPGAGGATDSPPANQ